MLFKFQQSWNFVDKCGSLGLYLSTKFARKPFSLARVFEGCGRSLSPKHCPNTALQEGVLCKLFYRKFMLVRFIKGTYILTIWLFEYRIEFIMCSELCYKATVVLFEKNCDLSPQLLRVRSCHTKWTRVIKNTVPWYMPAETAGYVVALNAALAWLT